MSRGTEKDVLARRAARFGSAPARSSTGNHLKAGNTRRPQNVRNTTDADYEFEHQLVGTCEMLEKCYLRLTSAPKESEVRPRHVLLKSLERVKEMWKEGCDYQRASELLKSIRQDMTVQGIRDQLSIDVYETHARLALLSKDPAEFNVCLSMLEVLYDQVPSNDDLRHEFKACRILYYLYTRDLADLTSLLGAVLLERKVSPRQKSVSVSHAAKQRDISADHAVGRNVIADSAVDPDITVDHAVDAAIFWFLGSYHQLLKLYKTAPRLSSLVMDLFLDRERRDYFSIIMTAYRPCVPTDFLCSELVLHKNDTFSFLEKVGAVFTDTSRTKIDCKATLANLK